MMLSHAFKTGVTTGFIKGTPSSDIAPALKHLRGCSGQVGHPMLLSTIILSHDLSPANDEKQRDARDWLRRLENAVSMRDEVEEGEQYFQDGILSVDGLNRDLVECHSHVMWKRPQAYFVLVREMELCMERFKVAWMDARRDFLSEEEEEHRKTIDRLHRSMLARMEFYKVKLKGLENYIHTTLERLKVQREAVSFFFFFLLIPFYYLLYHGGFSSLGLLTNILSFAQLYNIISQREARLNLEIAGEQRRIAHASKRDSTAMKTISLMGALFLPGTYLASVFSMTFFNFDAGKLLQPNKTPPFLFHNGDELSSKETMTHVR